MGQGLRVGIMGGTFDPPHRTHLALALAAQEAFKLDQVLFIPNARNPLRRIGPKASPKDRFRMVKLLVEGHEGLAVSDIDLGRSGPSYSVDTVRDLSQVMPADFWWILGSDAAKQLEEWHDVEKLAKMTRFAVAIRPPDTKEMVLRHVPERLHPALDFMDFPASKRSSTAIRENLGLGRDEGMQLVPAVANYIAEHNLYQEI